MMNPSAVLSALGILAEQLQARPFSLDIAILATQDGPRVRVMPRRKRLFDEGPWNYCEESAWPSEAALRAPNGVAHELLQSVRAMVSSVDAYHLSNLWC